MKALVNRLISVWEQMPESAVYTFERKALQKLIVRLHDGDLSPAEAEIQALRYIDWANENLSTTLRSVMVGTWKEVAEITREYRSEPAIAA